MRLLFYRWLIFMSRILGPWFFRWVAGMVACGYFLLLPGRTRHSVRFYRVLFPERNRAAHLLCALRQYINFTTLYLDRLLPEEQAKRRFHSSGWCHIEEALEKGRGAVVLMSHMGNWETAVRQMRTSLPGKTQLLLYMGRRNREQIESLQKQGLGDRDIGLVAAQSGRTDALDILEGMRVLASGGVVSMTGDRLWSGQERHVRVLLLGRQIRVPQMPFRLAMAARAPVIVFFSFRGPGGTCQVTAAPPIFVERGSRGPKETAVHRAAQQYADRMEAALRDHPFQWYHFGPFLEE